MTELLEQLKSFKFPTSLEGAWEFINNMNFAITILVVAVLLVFAIYGYKLFRIALYFLGGAGFTLGYKFFLAEHVTNLLKDVIPEGLPVDLEVILALACGIIGIFITRFAHKFMVFVLSGVAGYLIGTMYVAGLLANYFTDLAFLTHQVAIYIIGGVCAAILAIFMLLVYRHLFIILTSIGGFAASFFLLTKLVAPQADILVLAIVAGVGAILGVIATKFQFDESNKEFEFEI